MKRHWVGPLLGWEIVRLGRRGNVTLLRVIVGMILLLAVTLLYMSENPFERAAMLSQMYGQWSGVPTADKFSLTTKLLTEFAERFNQEMLLIELALVILLTPFYIAGAIAEERDRKTLEFLLATDLSPWEIIVGKLGSRLLQLTNVLLVCIPVVAIMQVWGGVNLRLVVAAFAIAIVSMIATAAFSISASLRGTTLKWSLIRCFVPLILFHTFILMAHEGKYFWGRGAVNYISPMVCLTDTLENPVVVQTFPEQFLIATSIFIAFHLLATWYFLADATRNLRKLAFRTVPRKINERKAKNPEHRHWADPPAIGPEEDGLYWKEKHFSGSQNRFIKQLTLMPTWLWIAIVVTLGMVAMTTVSGTISAYNTLTKIFGLVFLFVLMLIVGMAACASVARERQKETLVDLVMIPVERRHILSAKWWGSLTQGHGVYGGIFALAIVGALCLGISVLAIPGIMVLAFVWACFAVSVGVWVSVRCKSVQRASGYWIAFMLGWFGGGYMLASSVDSALHLRYNPYSYTSQLAKPIWIDRQLAFEFLVAASPVHAWDRLTFDVEESSGGYDYYGRVRHLSSGLELVAPTVNLFVLLLFVALFWTLARRRFQRETYK